MIKEMEKWANKIQYKFFQKNNLEDFASGRVIAGKPGFTNYPVRLAGEIFMRCLEAMGGPERKVRLYDPLCGGGYLLTVIGLLCGRHIGAVYASDVSEDAVMLAAENLRLLTVDGLLARKKEIAAIYDAFHKDAHLQALKSVDKLAKYAGDSIETHAFMSDALDESCAMRRNLPMIDMIITDVPYGTMVDWSEEKPFAIDEMLRNMTGILSDSAVIAVSSDKKQKINAPNFRRIEKFQVGRRKIEILKSMP